MMSKILEALTSFLNFIFVRVIYYFPTATFLSWSTKLNFGIYQYESSEVNFSRMSYY